MSVQDLRTPLASLTNKSSQLSDFVLSPSCLAPILAYRCDVPPSVATFRGSIPALTGDRSSLEDEGAISLKYRGNSPYQNTRRQKPSHTFIVRPREYDELFISNR
ncbi:hypothetical protein Trydic_g21600 [Trypoxylus dichotomus]